MRIATDLQLEERVAVDGNDVFQRFRKAVANLARVATDDVYQADRMARRDATRGDQRGEKAHDVEASQIGEMLRQQDRIDAGQVVAHHIVERVARDPAKCIEDGTVDLRRAEIGYQRIKAARGGSGDQLVIVRGEMAKR